MANNKIISIINELEKTFLSFIEKMNETNFFVNHNKYQIKYEDIMQLLKNKVINKKQSINFDFNNDNQKKFLKESKEYDRDLRNYMDTLKTQKDLKLKNWKSTQTTYYATFNSLLSKINKNSTFYLEEIKQEFSNIPITISYLIKAIEKFMLLYKNYIPPIKTINIIPYEKYFKTPKIKAIDIFDERIILFEKLYFILGYIHVEFGYLESKEVYNKWKFNDKKYILQFIRDYISDSSNEILYNTLKIKDNLVGIEQKFTPIKHFFDLSRFSNISLKTFRNIIVHKAPLVELEQEIHGFHEIDLFLFSVDLITLCFVSLINLKNEK